MGLSRAVLSQKALVAGAPVERMKGSDVVVEVPVVGECAIGGSNREVAIVEVPELDRVASFGALDATMD